MFSFINVYIQYNTTHNEDNFVFLDLLQKRGSNYSRSSRIMKPSDVRARQAAAMAEAGDSTMDGADMEGDAGLYTEPIYGKFWFDSGHGTSE